MRLMNEIGAELKKTELEKSDDRWLSIKATLAALGGRSETGEVELKQAELGRYLEYCQQLPQELIVVAESEKTKYWADSEWVGDLKVRRQVGAGGRGEYVCDIPVIIKPHPERMSAERLVTGIWASGLNSRSTKVASRTNWSELIAVPVLDADKRKVLSLIMTKQRAAVLVERLEPLVLGQTKETH